jgi:hypothetical protein
MLDHSNLSALRRCLIDCIGGRVRDRTVILAGSVHKNYALHRFFEDAGAARVDSLDLTSESELPLYRLMSCQQEVISNPTSEIRAFFDRVDPDNNAIVYAGSFVAQSQFCGREIIGKREQTQFESERKDRQAHLTRSLSRELDLADLEAAVSIVKEEARNVPLVVSGIPDRCLAIGASHTYLVAGGVTITEMLRRLASECSRAILTPFNFGIPCTFYGYMTRKWVIDFGPFEALVYWDLRSGRIDAPGILRPLLLNQEQEAAARNAVRDIAERLHQDTGYCGAFCTDGVMQDKSYIIHEINPRVCAGFSLLTEMAGSQIPLSLVDLALRSCPTSTEALRVPLQRLADQLQVQEPAVRLWDARHWALQNRLRSRARDISDVAGWMKEVRQSLAQEWLVPLISHFPDLP